MEPWVGQKEGRNSKIEHGITFPQPMAPRSLPRASTEWPALQKNIEETKTDRLFSSRGCVLCWMKVVFVAKVIRSLDLLASISDPTDILYELADFQNQINRFRWESISDEFWNTLR